MSFIKPLSILMLFAGLRSGEVIALKWRNINFTNQTLRVEQAITQVPKFDANGDIKDRITIRTANTVKKLLEICKR